MKISVFIIIVLRCNYNIISIINKLILLAMLISAIINVIKCFLRRLGCFIEDIA